MIKLDTLTTARLRLAPLTRAHSEGMYALWRAPEVCRYSGAAIDVHGAPIQLPARSAVDSDKIIDFFVARASVGLGFRWALLRQEDEKFLGALGFNSLARTAADERPELAFHLRPEFWGSGYMSEACTAALQWAARTLGAGEIEAWTDPANIASRQLLTRLGFADRATVRDGAQRYVACVRCDS